MNLQIDHLKDGEYPVYDCDNTFVVHYDEKQREFKTFPWFKKIFTQEEKDKILKDELYSGQYESMPNGIIDPWINKRASLLLSFCTCIPTCIYSATTKGAVEMLEQRAIDLLAQSKFYNSEKEMIKVVRQPLDVLVRDPLTVEKVFELVKSKSLKRKNYVESVQELQDRGLIQNDQVVWYTEVGFGYELTKEETELLEE